MENENQPLDTGSRPSILTRQDLDKVTCSAPGCDHAAHQGGAFVLHGRCHPRSTQIVRFLRETFSIEVICKRCNLLVAHIGIDPREAEPILAQLPEGQHTLRLYPHCSPKCRKIGALFLTYQDGHLLAVCARCKGGVGTMHVKDAEALHS